MGKNYQALIPNRIFIGGADAIPELLENEKIDMVYDLRAENKEGDYDYPRTHQAIVEDAGEQDETIEKAIKEIAEAYRSGKNVYFHCSTGRTRTGTVAAGTLLELGEAESIAEAKAKAREVREILNLESDMITALERLYPGRQ